MKRYDTYNASVTVNLAEGRMYNYSQRTVFPAVRSQKRGGLVIDRGVSCSGARYRDRCGIDGGSMGRPEFAARGREAGVRFSARSVDACAARESVNAERGLRGF